jgi:hypothetical protein
MLSRISIVTSIVLALALFGAGAAQAAEWEIEDVPLADAGISKAPTTTSGGTFELTIPKLSATVKCTSESGSGEILEGGGSGSVSFTLSSCTVAPW